MSDYADMLMIVLPDGSADDATWLRVSQDRVVDKGRGQPEDDSSAKLVVFAPAAAVAIDWLDLPDVPPAQRDAIARQQISDRVIGSTDDLHVTTQGDAVAWVSHAAMGQWLARLVRRPDSLIPLALAIPAPAEGLASAVIGGGTILRGDRLAVSADPAFFTHFGAPTETLSEKQVTAALIGAATAPPLDLLSGRYAPRQGLLDAKGTARSIKLAALALALFLLLNLVQIWKANHAASQLEASVRSRAAAQFPQSADPVADLNARLVANQGGGAGFLRTMAVVSGAIAGNPLAEMTRARFDPTGTLEVGLRVPTLGDVAIITRQIEAKGFAVEQAAPSTEQGRVVVLLKVRGS